jgi:hypothetical protein
MVGVVGAVGTNKITAGVCAGERLTGMMKKHIARHMVLYQP